MISQFEHRSDQQEMMDDLNCHGQEVNQTLKELGIINRWLGGNHITVNGIGKILDAFDSFQQPLSIADLGCGGGDMLNLVARWARKSGIAVKLYGIDANPNIVEYARSNSQLFPEITYETMDIFSQEFQSQQYDIILCTLFTHHFNETQLVRLFKGMYHQTKLGVVINDLHRHWLAYWSIRLITGLFSQSVMVRNDAPISVQRGFTKRELLRIVDEASIGKFQISWGWAFRWQLILQH